MRIKRVRLKDGYKRFYDLTIDLGEKPGRIVALVGANGSGKSSVLDGLMFRKNQHVRVGNMDARDDVYHSIDGSTPVSWKNVEIDFEDGNFNEVYEARSRSGRQSTMFSFRSPYRYNTQLKVSGISAVPAIAQNNYGATSAADIDSKVEQNYRRLLSAYSKFRDETDSKPSEAKAKIIGDLNLSIEACLQLSISSIGDVERSRGTLYFRKKDQKSEFPFDVLSSGEKEVVDLLLDLYLRRVDFDDSIFLFDEPELHINTSIQGPLLKEINRLVPDKCQIWLTTHSIGFLRALQRDFKDECQIIHFKNDLRIGEEQTTLVPLRPSHLAWRDIFSIALDDLSQLVCPQRIIYCEGRDIPGAGGAERGLDATIFNTIFAEKYPDTLFVSSGGNTELDQRSAVAIAILSKVFPNLELWVLKDRDMNSGKPSTEETRQQYLKYQGNGHRVLRRWEIENYLFDKEILSSYCHAEGLTFDETSYDDLVKNIDDQNIKDEIGRIKSICGISTNVNKEVFKKLLAEHVVSTTAVYADLENSIFNRQ